MSMQTVMYSRRVVKTTAKAYLLGVGSVRFRNLLWRENRRSIAESSSFTSHGKG